MKRALWGAVVLLTGCATTSPVMEAEDGTYVMSAYAAPVRGGATGATTVAYEESQKFCAVKGLRSVVVTGTERDVQQGVVTGSWTPQRGSIAGGSFAAGRANLRFRCVS